MHRLLGLRALHPGAMARALRIQRHSLAGSRELLIYVSIVCKEGNKVVPSSGKREEVGAPVGSAVSSSR